MAAVFGAILGKTTHPPLSTMNSLKYPKILVAHQEDDGEGVPVIILKRSQFDRQVGGASSQPLHSENVIQFPALEEGGGQQRQERQKSVGMRGEEEEGELQENGEEEDGERVHFNSSTQMDESSMASESSSFENSSDSLPNNITSPSNEAVDCSTSPLSTPISPYGTAYATQQQRDKRGAANIPPRMSETGGDSVNNKSTTTSSSSNQIFSPATTTSSRSGAKSAVYSALDGEDDNSVNHSQSSPYQTSPQSHPEEEEDNALHQREVGEDMSGEESSYSHEETPEFNSTGEAAADDYESQASAVDAWERIVGGAIAAVVEDSRPIKVEEEEEEEEEEEDVEAADFSKAPSIQKEGERQIHWQSEKAVSPPSEGVMQTDYQSGEILDDFEEEEEVQVEVKHAIVSESAALHSVISNPLKVDEGAHTNEQEFLIPSSVGTGGMGEVRVGSVEGSSGRPSSAGRPKSAGRRGGR